jgi:hypothetical protein
METNNLTSKSTSNLNEAAKWANVMAIIGFVGLGLSLLSFFFILKGMPGQILVVYLLSITLYTIPYYFMFKFASGIKSNDVDSGISNLKSYFKFIAILTIIVIALSLIGGVFLASYISKFI